MGWGCQACLNILCLTLGSLFWPQKCRSHKMPPSIQKEVPSSCTPSSFLGPRRLFSSSPRDWLLAIFIIRLTRGEFCYSGLVGPLIAPSILCQRKIDNRCQARQLTFTHHKKRPCLKPILHLKGSTSLLQSSAIIIYLPCLHYYQGRLSVPNICQVRCEFQPMLITPSNLSFSIVSFGNSF